MHGLNNSEPKSFGPVQVSTCIGEYDVYEEEQLVKIKPIQTLNLVHD